MTTPDAALALAALWAYERARRARVGGVCVTGGGFKAAIFCDVVSQYYRPGERHGNDALAVGLADIDDLPADQPMVSVPVDRRAADGEPLYARTIDYLTDTSLAESQLRNAITYNAESTVILSAPASSLARSLEIVANRDLYSEPVLRLILVDTPRLHTDAAALDYLLANWPTEIVVLGAEATEGLTLASAALESAFGWADPHPVVDALRAWRDTPYDIPAADLAAMVFAVARDDSLLSLSAPGRLVNSGGTLGFNSDAGGRHRQLLLPSGTDLERQLIEAASAEPGQG